MIRRIERMWALAPFKKVLEKRQHENKLLESLNECVHQLFRDPTSPGLNLETLNHTGSHAILSARITKAYRLILVELGKTQVGLLYFDNHDEAYTWVDRHRSDLPSMLAKSSEVIREAPLSVSFERIPAVLADVDSPLAIASAEQFQRMTQAGITRYLTFLDDEQRRVAEQNVSGLLLVKGGAGTGKTAVAIHRVLNLARQPALPGMGGVLYFCFNSLLARVVRQLLETLGNGVTPPEVEVKTFHAWCRDFLQDAGAPVPVVDEEGCRQSVYRALGRIAPEIRVTLGKHDGRFIDDEIEHVIKHNGLASLDAYLNFNRKGRRVSLKRSEREAIWAIHEQAQRYQDEQGICRWSDLPMQALAVLDALPEPPQYRAVIIDEGQDCSPVMVRLARRLVLQTGGSLTVFADPAQAIYESGFQWTQRELRPTGGNVRWLRNNYRSTQAIFDLARPLLEDSEDLREDLEQLERPRRTGMRPGLIIANDEAELQLELIERVMVEAAKRPLNFIAILGAKWAALQQLESALVKRGIPARLLKAAEGLVRLEDPTVKLLTMQSAKGLDFPVVFLVTPHPEDLGGSARAQLPETRRTLYVALTRASEHLTIGALYNHYHPLLELIATTSCHVEGSRGREYALMH